MHTTEAAAFKLDHLQGEELIEQAKQVQQLLSTANRQQVASEGSETHHSSPAGRKQKAPNVLEKSINSGKAREHAVERSRSNHVDPRRDEDQNRARTQNDKEKASPEPTRSQSPAG